MVSSIFYSTISYRIKCGLGKIWLKTRKIEKVCEWFTKDQNERMIQLRCQWKKALLLFIKPTPSF